LKINDVCFVGEPTEAEARARASNEDGDIKRISTKEWAKSTGYDPVKLFTKVRFPPPPPPGSN
jgi:hypothetical protein